MTQLLPIEMAPKPGNASDRPATFKGLGVEDASLGQDDDVPVGKSFSEALEQEKMSGEADHLPPQSNTVETDTKLQPEEDVAQSDFAVAPAALQEDAEDTPKATAQSEPANDRRLPNVQSATASDPTKMQPQRTSQAADTQSPNPSDAQEAQDVQPKAQVTIKETNRTQTIRSPQGTIGAIMKASLAPANGEEADGAKSSVPQNPKQAGPGEKPNMQGSDPAKKPEAPLRAIASNTAPKAATTPTEQSQGPAEPAKSEVLARQTSPVSQPQAGVAMATTAKVEMPETRAKNPEARTTRATDAKSTDVATTEQVLKRRNANGHSPIASQSISSPKPTDSILTAPNNSLESVAVLAASGDAGDSALGGIDAGRAVRNEASQPFFARTAAMAPQQQAASIGAQIADVARQGQPGQIELRLNPEELGRLKMTFEGNETSMIVTIAAERPETSELMRRHIEQLAREMAANGFENVQFQFAQEQSADGQTTDENTHHGPNSPQDPAPSSDTSPTSSKTTAHGPSPIIGAGLDLRI
ncbi:MAG: flagellar hook-length control protein FliK [Oceanicola sp.]|nr:flagellar hook-length control protein FliK [Oceanicola sp.]